jgi:UDP-N-acetylglucosamine enolpyruvyl transferase
VGRLGTGQESAEESRASRANKMTHFREVNKVQNLKVPQGPHSRCTIPTVLEGRIVGIVTQEQVSMYAECEIGSRSTNHLMNQSQSTFRTDELC